MLFAVKFVHSIIFFFMSGCIVYVWYAGLTRTYNWMLAVALLALTAEIIVWWFNGKRCPLTDIAQYYGDTNGGHDLISDIFLPRGVAERIVPVSSAVLSVGLIVLIVSLFVN